MSEKYLSLDEALCAAIYDVLQKGSKAAPRGQGVIEVLGMITEFDMKYPILTNPSRNLGYRFLFAEAWWIISGRNDVKSIAPYSKVIGNFSDDGEWFQGAYGPKLINQLSYVINSLAKDQGTRQAVATIWEPNPRASKDHSCTVAVEWTIRDGKLHCFDHMRSSDLWLGLPYDAFNFTMVSAYIALALKHVHGIEVELGRLKFLNANQHIYDRNLSDAKVACGTSKFTALEPLDLKYWGNHHDLLDYLDRAKDRQTVKGEWLHEFIQSQTKGDRKDSWYEDKS
jgi:thymidylate synthase